MFTVEEMEAVIASPLFTDDVSAVRQALVNERVHQKVLLSSGAHERLIYFVDAVLGSIVEWTEGERGEICRVAAEAAESLAARFRDEKSAPRLRFRAALLYELANLPALAMAALDDDDLPQTLFGFFQRKGVYGELNGKFAPDLQDSMIDVAHAAFMDDVTGFARISQSQYNVGDASLFTESVTEAAARLAVTYDIGITASELDVFRFLIRDRLKRATIRSLPARLEENVRDIHFPAELLPAQKAAVDGGLLDSSKTAWGFAAPTGSGKTYLARLLILDILGRRPDAKILYVVPSKALVSEVSNSLAESLGKIGFHVHGMSAQLVDLDDSESERVEENSVVVLTPEKADLLLRLNAEFIENVAVVVIDEAHHIESGTRGALLEFYIWRMRRLLPGFVRYVFLSAVTPNIGQITKWVDENSSAVRFDVRPTRMRVGVYSVSGTGKRATSQIIYTDGTRAGVTDQGATTAKRKGVCELTAYLAEAGPVLVVAKGKKECENIAEELREWLRKCNKLEVVQIGIEGSDTPLLDLDAALEREMYSDVLLRKLIKNEIAYHHAGLPPKVRIGVERAIRSGHIKYVIATTTLAEGVNFPFSSVVVQSLALRDPPEAGRPQRYSPITPRAFWNIAGRAGRPGFDPEGQVVLFEPSLGLDKIDAVIGDYTNPNMAALSPVTSALAAAINEIADEIHDEKYTLNALKTIELPTTISRRARGAVNLVRVGVLHARAAGIEMSPEEIVESTFAFEFMSADGKAFARSFMRGQADAMDAYLSSDTAPDVKKLAELGLSLETLAQLESYVRNMETWQLQGFQKLLFGGKVNLRQAAYIVGPVAKRITELEGRALGGFLSDVIIKWISGITFTSIRSQAKFDDRLEDLISVIYSKVQFLLPWGLWATDWIVEQEAKERVVNYDNQIKNLAYLADAGVPSFDALRLTHIGIERVDASRLARAYEKRGGMETGVDCLKWVMTQPREVVEQILRGQDRRRIDPAFFDRLELVRSSSYG